MRTDKTAGVILREVKKYLGDDAFKVGMEAVKSSERDRDAFLRDITPYLKKVELLKKDKVAFKKFNSLSKTTDRINFLNGYRAEETNSKPRGAKPKPRGAKLNPRGAKPKPRGAKLNPNRVSEKAKSVKKEVDMLEKGYEEEKKINVLEAYRVAKNKKFNDVNQYSLAVYTETEELVTQREINYLIAREEITELEKQIKIIRDYIKYYKYDNIQLDKVSSLEKGLQAKLKALGSAKKDVKHFAPKSKKLLNYVGGALVAPIKLVVGLFVTPKPVELTPEQIIKIEGVR